MGIVLITLQDEDSIRRNLAAPLINSLARYNHRVTVIDTYDKALGNLSKLYKVRDYLSDNHSLFQDDDVVVFVDAHDVVFPPHTDARKNLLDNLREDFLRTQLDYMVGTETRYSHQFDSKSFFDDQTDHVSRYINTGFQIGFYRAFIEIYSYIITNLPTYSARFRRAGQKRLDLRNIKLSEEQWTRALQDDQGAISQFYVAQKTDCVIPGLQIGMDYKRDFVSTLNSRTPFVPAEINSYFIHVTWLANPNQRRKFNEVLEYYAVESVRQPPGDIAAQLGI
jgi:hypothetical protein